MRIFLSAGEPSGDLHAANLAREIKKRYPDAEIVGFGGKHSEEAGVKLLYPLTDLAVMWFLQVFWKLPKFFELAKKADDYFRDHRPDAVVLIDYPGFHWALAKRAKARGIKVIYYVPPQLWAWAGWRVEKVRKWIDHVLCSLPFEPDWYKERGIEGATYVGHPYFDELDDRPLDCEFLDSMNKPDRPIVALLPGSRTQEVTRNFPVLLRSAVLVAKARPDVRFVVACLHEKHRLLAEKIAKSEGVSLDSLEFHAGRTPEIIRIAELAWAVSGSVSLELMNEALPTVVVYTIKKFDLFVAKRFMKTKFICLVNVIAGEAVMPEFLTDRDVSNEMAQYAIRWLNEPAERSQVAAKLARLRDEFARPGASIHAAERVISVVLEESRAGTKVKERSLTTSA
jgi:lipid-A-disaccharide synthase